MVRQGLKFSPFFIALKCLIFEKRIDNKCNAPRPTI
jgi:hypothetical protein